MREQLFMHCEEWHYGSIGEMYRAVKEGKPAIAHLYQVDNYWHYLVQHPESQRHADQRSRGEDLVSARARISRRRTRCAGCCTCRLRRLARAAGSTDRRLCRNTSVLC